MGIFESVDEKRTILPVKVSDIDIYPALERIEFDPSNIQGEVAADYIAGLMDLYRDTGGREDILGKVIREHFREAKEEGIARLRKQLKPNLPFQKPKMVPWALYEIVAEEVRKELAQQKGFEEKVDPTVFPFLIGVYSLMAHPAVVLSSSVLSIEGLIENVNRFGRRLNTVTTMETIEQGKYDPETQLMKATLRRQQDGKALQALEDLLKKGEQKNIDGILEVICTRDLATVCGALVGGSLLKGQRLRYIEVTGDPRGATDITIYYPQAYRTAIQPGRVFHAIGLAATARKSGESPWREGYLVKSLDDAIAPLNAVASKALSRRIEALTRAEEAEIRIRRLRELAREASHHVKNPASALLGILRRLVPDEKEIFKEIKDDEKRRAHMQIVREIGGADEYKIEGMKGMETQQRLNVRYDAYKRRAEQERIIPLARRIFDPLCGTYMRARANASVSILDEFFVNIKAEDTQEMKKINAIEVHYQRMRKGLMDAERIAEEIIQRTKSLSTLVEGDSTRDEMRKEQFCLYDAVVQGVQLLKMQPDKPTVVIHTVPKVQVRSHRNTIVSVVENITWNAYEAIQGKAGLDPTYKGEAVVIHYDGEKRIMYIANTGPAIPDHRIAEIFSLKTRTAIARGGLKQVTGTGTSMMLKRDILAALEQKLECYNTKTKALLKEKHVILREYGVNVIFGIEFKS